MPRVCMFPLSCAAACAEEENMAGGEQLSPEPHRVCDGVL